MSKLSVLMTVYNEADFIEHAIQSCLPHVDNIVVVEGSYLETIVLGASPRSTDGTIEKAKKYVDNKKVFYIEANEQTDKDQRNVGLQKIKELNPDGWLLIIDGDEIYDTNSLKMVQVAMKNMERSNKYAAYFKSLTFVNNEKSFVDQEFPRLFKVTPECLFVNDNFMSWPDKGLSWNYPHVIKIPYIHYWHFSFCKGKKRFELKRNWWMNRGLGDNFDYGWSIDENDNISDPNHEIRQYTGKFPEILKDHPLFKNKK